MLSVGDKVVLKDEIKKEIKDSEAEETIYNLGEQGGLSFVENMKRYVDMELTISDIDEDGDMNIEEDEGAWFWSEKWFEKVENELKGAEDF